MRMHFFKVILISLSVFCVVLGDIATLKPQVESKAIKNHSWYTPNKGPPSIASGTPTARDSYADAASDMGYNMDSYTGNQITTGSQTIGTTYSGGSKDSSQGLTYHYKIYPGSYPSYSNPVNDYASSYNGHKGHVRQDIFNNNYDDYGDGGDADGGGGALGGLVGLLGLLGLKGFKGFKLWKLFQLAPVLLPLFLPILLPIILPLLLLGLAALLVPLGLLLLIPIPVITIPTVRGRSLMNEGVSIARDLIMNEDCVEKISCEVSRYARGYGFNPTWVQKLAEKNSTNKWIDRISRSAQNTNCATYTCKPMEKLQKSLKSKSSALYPPVLAS